jgi:hypothetical protein
MNEAENKYMLRNPISLTSLPALKDTDIDLYLTDVNMDIVKFQNSYFTLDLSIDVSFPNGFPLFFGTKPNFIPDFVDPSDVYPKWKDFYTDTSSADYNAAFDHWYDIPIFQDLAKMQFIFFGFKSATDVISKLNVKYNNLDISDAITDKYKYQSFYINVVKPKIEKENKKNIHTLWEEAHDFNQSICGKYVSYWELYQAHLSGNNKITIVFPVNIKFDDIIHFLAMDEYPNSVFGQLRLTIQVQPDALVWCPVNPRASIEKLLETYVPDSASNSILAQTPFSFLSQIANQLTNCDYNHIYDKRFFNQRTLGRTPMNIMGYSIGDIVQLATYFTKDICIQVETVKVNAATSNIYGYKLKHSYIEKLKKYYTDKPMIVPSEKIRFHLYGTAPLINGLEVSSQFPIRNAKELVFLFPRTAFDLTCFCNPILDSFSVTIQNEAYPTNPTSTVSADFYNQQLNAACLGGILACTESFETSNVAIPSWTYPGRDRIHHDNTEFAHFLLLQRPSANCYNQDSPLNFDQSSSVQLSGKYLIMKNPDNTSIMVDNYYILNRHNRQPHHNEPVVEGETASSSSTVVPQETNVTPPIMLAISDSFWIFQYKRIPKYVINKTWDDTLKENFTALYNQLIDLVNGK